MTRESVNKQLRIWEDKNGWAWSAPRRHCRRRCL